MDFINDLALSAGQKEYLKGLMEKIKSVMPVSLYQHSINTLEYAGIIAEKHPAGLDVFDLGIVCVLHDYGKVLSYEELVETALKNKLKLSSFVLGSRPLIHGFVGAYLVSRDFSITKKKVLKAIRFHTIGYCNMSLEDKIFFISDKIEKSRGYNGVEKCRDLALKNIDLCLLEVYKNNIIYVIKKNGLLHPDTSKIWNNICGGI
jgi:predicted HD superfamily hydrolase involved in NAD metabolism